MVVARNVLICNQSQCLVFLKSVSVRNISLLSNFKTIWAWWEWGFSGHRARLLLKHSEFRSRWNPTVFFVKWKKINKRSSKGIGCGSVGRAVFFDSRCPWFKSHHRQKFKLNFYCQLYWKDENKEKEAAKGLFLKRSRVWPFLSAIVNRLQ